MARVVRKKYSESISHSGIGGLGCALTYIYTSPLWTTTKKRLQCSPPLHVTRQRPSPLFSLSLALSPEGWAATSYDSSGGNGQSITMLSSFLVHATSHTNPTFEHSTLGHCGSCCLCCCIFIRLPSVFHRRAGGLVGWELGKSKKNNKWENAHMCLKGVQGKLATASYHFANSARPSKCIAPEGEDTGGPPLLPSHC